MRRPSTVLGGRYAVRRRLAQRHPEPSGGRPRHHPRARSSSCASPPATPTRTLPSTPPAGPGWTTTASCASSTSAARMTSPSSSRRPCTRRTVTHLLEQGGLPSEEAAALPARWPPDSRLPAAVGCTHLRLTPSYVLRTGDGAIKLSGLRDRRSSAGVDDLDSAEAARVDAVRSLPSRMPR